MSLTIKQSFRERSYDVPWSLRSLINRNSYFNYSACLEFNAGRGCLLIQTADNAGTINVRRIDKTDEYPKVNINQTIEEFFDTPIVDAIEIPENNQAELLALMVLFSGALKYTRTRSDVTLHFC